jgi:predicted nuclease of predicted toxin-antitoxin system
VQLLLDEDVPKPLVPALRRILAGHEVIHVDDLRWKGKKDLNLLADAAQRGFDAILTNDSKQLDDAAECRAIRDSGLHQLALALGAILAGIRQVVRELDEADGQRLVLIHEIRSERRHDTIDPRIDPPPYWPSKPSPTRRKRQ